MVAREISWAIDRSARLLPVRLVCLPRALTAWQMLHVRGIWSRIHCGASRDPEGTTLITHAWVDVGDVEVTGYPARRITASKSVSSRGDSMTHCQLRWSARSRPHETLRSSSRMVRDVGSGTGDLLITIW